MGDSVGAFQRQALEQMLRDFKGGEPDLVLFTTFNFSASFFEANVLPLLAGYSIEQVKGTAGARVEVNATLERVKTLVVCDASARPEPKGDLRYGVMPVRVEAGRFHPKLVLMSGELERGGGRGLRLLVGSGNLSISGWRVNREVVGVTPVAAKHVTPLGELLRWLLREAERRVAWVGEGRRDSEEGQARMVLKSLLDALRSDSVADSNDTLPDLFLGMPPSTWDPSDPPRGNSLLADLAGGKAWSQATLVSPFWGEIPKLLPDLIAQHYRFVPSIAATGTYAFPVEALEEKVLQGKYEFLRFAAEKERYTHAKAMLLEAASERVLCIGSANFTTAAMKHGAGRLSNVEAVLRYRMAGGDPWQGHLESLEEEHVAPAHEDPEEEGAPPLPPFEAEVVCDWSSRTFFCRVKIAEGECLESLVLEVGGHRQLLNTVPAVEQCCQLRQAGCLPARNFFLLFASGGRQDRFQGLVTQLNASDDELGYSPRPRLEGVLELLRSLDPDQPNGGVKRRRGVREDGDDEEGPDREQQFDMFKFYQATYKMRNFYSRHPEFDPFDASALHGMPRLVRAVELLPQDSPQEAIERYLQFTELLDTLYQLLEARRGKREFKEESVTELKLRLEQVIDVLETTLIPRLVSSQYFRDMFGKNADSAKATKFLEWYRKELKEHAHA